MPNPKNFAEKYGFELEPYTSATKKFFFTCNCGTKGVSSYGTLQTGLFCRNSNCDYYRKQKKFDVEEMKIIFEERGCTVIDIKGTGGKAEIEFICSCGFKQHNTWLRFYNDTWCHHFACEHKRRLKVLTTELLKDWFEFENYTYLEDLKYNSPSREINKKLTVFCPEGHEVLITTAMWIDGSRCKICHGDGRTLSFQELKKCYEDQGCKLLYEAKDFKGNVTKNCVPYICSNGHTIDNLTKNDFNNRINQKLGPCVVCNDEERQKERDEKEPFKPIDDEELKILIQKYPRSDEKCNWKRLKGYSRYEISDLGLVRNVTSGKVLKGTIYGDEYITVTLYPDSDYEKPKNTRIHRAVATLFCSGKSEENNIVNHKNTIKTDNRASNLEWVTTRQNTQHAVASGLINVTNRRPINRISLSGEIKTYPSITDAYNDNKDVIGDLTYIIAVCSGKQITAGGYKWEYVDPFLIEIEPENGKIIKGYENYLIVPEGNVYSKSSKKYLNPSVNGAGYMMIDLFADKYDEKKDVLKYSTERSAKRKKFRVHRLVAEYFIHNPNPELYVEVNHKNKNRGDNRVENLEWCTQLQNAQHAHNKPVSMFDEKDNITIVFDSMNEASLATGINHKNISSCIRKNVDIGKKYTAGGYIWRYINEACEEENDYID